MLGFFLAFLVIIPALILYVTGYRLNNEFKLVRTGGIYIHAFASDVSLYINDEDPFELSLFRTGFFIQNLLPDYYNLKMTKEGYYPWVKRLKVYPHMVAEAFPVMIPQNISLKEVELSTSTINTIFNGPENLINKNGNKGNINSSTSTIPVIKRGKVEISFDSNTIYSEWKGTINNAPSYFCLYEECFIQKKKILEAPRKILDVDFYPQRSDVIIFSTDIGIFVAEIDLKYLQNVIPIYSAKNKDVKFMVNDDGTIYIKDGDIIYLADIR